MRFASHGEFRHEDGTAKCCPLFSVPFPNVHIRSLGFSKTKKNASKNVNQFHQEKKNNIISQQLHHLLPTYVPTPKTHFREKIHLALGRQKAKAKRARSRLEHCPSSG